MGATDAAGVSRSVNPQLKLAGDAVGKSDIDSLHRLCATNPQNKFMCTMLARENMHELAVAARKHRNLLVFGCWWFTNVPVLATIPYIASGAGSRVLRMAVATVSGRSTGWPSTSGAAPSACTNAASATPSRCGSLARVQGPPSRARKKEPTHQERRP